MIVKRHTRGDLIDALRDQLVRDRLECRNRVLMSPKFLTENAVHLRNPWRDVRGHDHTAVPAVLQDSPAAAPVALCVQPLLDELLERLRPGVVVNPIVERLQPVPYPRDHVQRKRCLEPNLVHLLRNCQGALVSRPIFCLGPPV